MRRGIAPGLVAVGILLGAVSLLQHTVGLVALRHGALYLGLAAAFAAVSGATLWLVDRRQSATPDGAAELIARPAVIGGRVRTRGIPYQMPYDVEEMNRLDLQHYLLRATLGGNYLAPIGSPGSILDVGTGTGRWARELAVAFPEANVVGLDVNPPAVDEASEGRGDELRPPNYTFVAGNVLEGLPFADDSFDFVHMRALLTAIQHDRWPYVVGELLRVTRPGGWVESLECSLLQGGGPAVDQLMTWLTATIARKKVEFADGGRVGEFLRDTGRARVTTREVPIPCGDYGGRIGKMLAADWFSVLGAFRGPMVAQGIADGAQIDQALARARAALAAPDVRAVMTVYVADGQRGRMRTASGVTAGLTPR